MPKRAPALGRKARPGPIIRLPQQARCPWCERYHGGGKCLTYGIYISPARTIQFEK